MTEQELQALARLGAERRLQEINEELAQLDRLFPEIRRDAQRAQARARVTRFRAKESTKRSSFSAKMSEVMRARWAGPWAYRRKSALVSD
jgi:hypothetical protein